MRFPEFSGEWAKFRNDSLFNVVSEKNKGKQITSVLSASQTDGMVSRDSLGIDIKFEEDSIKNYKIVREGDYVIHLRSFQGGFAFSDRVGVCSPAYTILRPTQQISYGFLKPFFMSNKFIDSLRLVTYGIRDGKSISVEEWLKLNTNLPSVEEQKKISIFLSLLDDRIATQIKIIEKLESLIKGLYERLFNIDGAAYIQLGNVAKIQKGQQINGEELSEIGSYYVMNGGVVPSGYLEDFNTPANTISISEGGNSCGYVQYNGVPFWSGGHCYTLIEPINSFNYKYLFHYLKFKEQSIMALRIGSGLPNIQKKDLERFPILNVSKEEQDKMACIFDDILDRIICERQIALKYEEQKKYLLSNLFI